MFSASISSRTKPEQYSKEESRRKVGKVGKVEGGRVRRPVKEVRTRGVFEIIIYLSLKLGSFSDSGDQGIQEV